MKRIPQDETSHASDWLPPPDLRQRKSLNKFYGPVADNGFTHWIGHFGDKKVVKHVSKDVVWINVW